jgi:uncharacterized repeat protein (TIGR03803 family)
MTRIKSYQEQFVPMLVFAAILIAMPAQAQTFSVLYDFGSRSGDPQLVSGYAAQGFDGNLYNVSNGGGANGTGTGDGTVFKVTPAGKLSVIYSFCSQANCVDGRTPAGGLTLRPDGHFLGVTVNGGSQGFGTVFDVSATGSLITLHSFAGGADGASPDALPILGPDGSFYGAATFGGRPSNCGTLYRITGTVFTSFYEFDLLHGCHTSLTLGADGNFYGVGSSGGTSNDGVVFKLTLRPGMAALVTVLSNFDGTNGSEPNGLVQGSDGNFYGTTAAGGTANAGVIFKVTPAGDLTVLHNINPATDGRGLFAGLTQATDGNFYGATSNSAGYGCTSDCGNLFEITPAGSFSVLHTFNGTDGSFPDDTLFQHTNGLLYGDTAFGGTGTLCAGGSDCGVLYNWGGSLPAFVSTVPFVGNVGHFVAILGQGFDSSTTVSFNGTPAAATVVSGTYLKTAVPAGATTGFVTVTTSTGTLTSNKQFVVTP